MHCQSLLEPSVLAFNFLPSRTLHVTQWMRFNATPFFIQAIEKMPERENLWHRYWSQHILDQTGLKDQWVTDLSDPLLPLALSSPQALAEHARALGVVLCRPRLQRFIGGQAVRALQTQLGEAFRWVYAEDPPQTIPLDVLPATPFKGVEEAIVWVDALGWRGLYESFRRANTAILERVRLKLPLEALSSPAWVAISWEAFAAQDMATLVLKISESLRSHAFSD